MEHAFLIRDEVSSECVRSTLVAGVEYFQVLERPWLNNAINISCIPAGTYKCNYMARSASGKYRNVYWIKGVPGRTGILIHNGNTVNHSRGCLIIGKRRGWLAGRRAVLNSKSALVDLSQIYNGRDFMLTIIGDQKC